MTVITSAHLIQPNVYLSSIQSTTQKTHESSFIKNMREKKQKKTTKNT